jgi:hypothetical protein
VETLTAAKRVGLKIVEVPVPYQPHDSSRPKLGGNSGVTSLCSLWFRRLVGRV